jgi:hypothetical protein
MGDGQHVHLFSETADDNTGPRKQWNVVVEPMLTEWEVDCGQTPKNIAS